MKNLEDKIILVFYGFFGGFLGFLIFAYGLGGWRSAVRILKCWWWGKEEDGPCEGDHEAGCHALAIIVTRL